jgi:ClpP class serine protease
VFSAAAAGREPLRVALVRQRSALLQALEQERGSRIITLIHRVELGEHADQFITIEDSEEILNEIRLIPDDTPLDLILHCPGRIVLAAEQIALALKDHSGKVTAIVPHYAMSGATLLCLSADEILMDPHGVMGPLDPQIGHYPAPSLVKLLATKPVEAVSDEMLVLADIATKALHQTQSFVRYLLKDRMGEEKSGKLAEFLTGGYLTHDSPLVPEQLQLLGLPVRVGVPPEVYALLRLHKLSHPRSGSADAAP